MASAVGAPVTPLMFYLADYGLWHQWRCAAHSAVRKQAEGNDPGPDIADARALRRRGMEWRSLWGVL